MTAHRAEPDQHEVVVGGLEEAYRKIVRVHATLAASDRDPVDLRDWTIDQLGEVIGSLESALGSTGRPFRADDRMTKTEATPPTMLWRQIYGGAIRSAAPHLLLRETSRFVVTYIRPGVRWKVSSDYGDEDWMCKIGDGWKLNLRPWKTRHVLRVAQRDAPFSIDARWIENTLQFDGWCINLQQVPIRRLVGANVVAYDTLDHVIDIEVMPDEHLTAHLKDESELDRAVACGVFTAQQASEIRATTSYIKENRQRLIEQTSKRLGSLLSAGWEAWQPDPSWALPSLPDGWDQT